MKIKNRNTQVPYNIKIRFAGAVVTIRNHDETIELTGKCPGVKLWMQHRAGNEWRPMATVPDGTLDRYMHERPEILSCDWRPE